METALEQLKQYLQQPGTPPPSRTELEALCTRYPWFAAPYAVLCEAYADQLSDSELLGLRQRHAVLTAGCAVGGDAVATDGNQDPQPLAPPQFAPPLPVVPPPFTGLADDAQPATPPPFTGFDIDDTETADTSVATESSVSEPSATDQVLSTYFSTFGHTTAEEDALLERMIFNPQPDYASVLMQQEAEEAVAPAGSHVTVQAEGGSAAVSHSSVPTGPSARQSSAATPQVSHTAALPGAAEVSEVAQALKPQRAAERPKQAADSSLLSESLAKIFIKQGRYDRAYEIISNLNLNYPEKSVYFADQLRFLRKLMHLQAAAQQAKENHGE